VWVEELKSGRWRGVFRVAGRKYSQTFDYEFEAAAWATEGESRAAAAGAPAPDLQAAPAAPVAAAAVVSGPTITAHGAEWIERRRGALEPGTVAWYRTHLDAITRTGMGLHRVNQVRRSDVERWVTGQRDDGTGAPTINARLKVLRILFTDAMRDRLTDANPAAGVDYLPTNATTDRVLDRDEEARLLAVAPAADLLAPVLVGLDAGLRWQEVYALPASAVRRDGFLGVWAAARRDGTIKGYTKDGRGRNVPIATDRLADALDDAARAAVARDGRGALLFPSASGGVMDYNNHRARLWRPTMRAAKITKAPGFHGLRHTYGSRLAAAGVPRVEIAELMGHADESTTKRYIHAGVDGRRAALVREALAAA
jgi:site-specific recombinase XerD